MNREEKLKLKFNRFFSSKLHLDDKDYYNELTAKDFIELKALLSNINNIITLKLTLRFIDELPFLFNLSNAEKAEIIKKVQAVSPNANGFDIEIEKPIKLVAEVKGNIPIKQGVIFGSAQNDGIKKDLRSLKKGKKKSTTDPDGFYKFMVLPDTEAVRKATDKLLSQLKTNKEYEDFLFEIVSDATKQFRTDTIYIIFIEV